LAAEALACIDAAVPDVLIADLAMPAMDGFGLMTGSAAITMPR
jgi:CheY-like chemotaxis protein